MQISDNTLAVARRHLVTGQPGRALETLAGLGPDFDEPEAWRLRGWALVGLDDFEGAIRAAQGGLEHAPDWPPLLHLLAVAHGHRNELADAERAILAAIELDPEDADHLCAYAELLARGGQVDKAERVVARAADLEPDDERVLQARLELAYVKGESARARELSEELLRLDPDNRMGHRMLGVSLLEKGNARQASRHFDTAARADVRDEEAAGVARDVRAAAHPLMWPLLPFERLGPVRVWLMAIVTIFVLTGLGLELAAGIFLFVYIALCVYSWVAPPLLRGYLRRRMG